MKALAEVSAGIVLAFSMSGCGSSSAPAAPAASDPGPSVHASLASVNVYRGNCVADLTKCTDEVPRQGNAFYQVPNGTTTTVKWCIAHPGLANRQLIIQTPTAGPQFFQESVAPSPVCVGEVNSSPLGICYANGANVNENLPTSPTGDLFNFHTGPLLIAANQNTPCP